MASTVFQSLPPFYSMTNVSDDRSRRLARHRDFLSRRSSLRPECRSHFTRNGQDILGSRLRWLHGDGSLLPGKLSFEKLEGEMDNARPEIMLDWMPGNCGTCTSRLMRRGCRGSNEYFVYLDSSLQHDSTFCKRLPFHAINRKRIRANASAGFNEPHVAKSAVLSEEGITENLNEQILDSRIEQDEINDFLMLKLPSHPKLHCGQLKNGLRYIILLNKVPPNRFEAHMEMHVGSVDERENEQGIAHMIEHVAFLGSKKREKLLGTGARSNAYTDFHHTVFHVHSPVTAQGANEPQLPVVLDALCEIAFKPGFLKSRVEKERRAILSELQMMNTIEYRVDCQLLQQLHAENLLGYRFPIGLEEQIKKWDADTIRSFHERWYFPANATLFVVGDLDSIGKTVELIQDVFGCIPAGFLNQPLQASATNSGPWAHIQVPKFKSLFSGVSMVDSSVVSSTVESMRKERHAVRPPVKHEWSLPKSGVTKSPHIFQHELLQNFSLSLFCKKPVQQVNTYGDLRDALMRRIVLSALQFRINTRYKSANPPFIAIELDHSDSGREGCSVTTLAVTAEPRKWRDAVKVAAQEVRRLKEFGVTRGELARYLNALLKDSEHLAAKIHNVSSIENLDFIMETDALGHTAMDQQQGHEALIAVADTVNLDDVNTIAVELLEYIAEFGKPTAPLPAAIVACVPKTIHQDGIGDSDFVISAEEILCAIKEGLDEPLIREPELEVPKELLSSCQLASLRSHRCPSFVHVEENNSNIKIVDLVTGITQRRLSNGIRINYKITKNEAMGACLRLVVAGGRAQETPDRSGAVAVGVRTLSESGTVGDFTREQVELFCVSHLMNCVLEADEEFLCMDFHFTLRDGGMRATFQLLHMVLEHNIWAEDALDRAKQLYLSYYRAMPKSLERATAYKLMHAMLDGEERFIEPSPHSIQKLTLPVVKDAVLQQLHPDNMEVTVVGDFAEEELEACLLDYLGTVTPSASDPDLLVTEQPIVTNPNPLPTMRHQKFFLKDTDERACAYIAGAAPNRWGYTADGRDLNTLMEPVPTSLTEEQAWSLAPSGVEVTKDHEGALFWKRQRHRLYASVALTLLAEIINARLFTTVRDALGLTYDVSFELSLFDRLKAGWFVISVTSTPAKVAQAVDASLNVLRGLNGSKINQRELDRAKRTLMMRHESDSKDNGYWIGLLTHLQAPSVARKDVGCIRDMLHLYETATVDDIHNAYNHLNLDDDSLFTCIGIAGMEAGKDVATLEIEQENTNIGEPISPLQSSLQHGRGLSTVTRPTL